MNFVACGIKQYFINLNRRFHTLYTSGKKLRNYDEKIAHHLAESEKCSKFATEKVKIATNRKD